MTFDAPVREFLAFKPDAGTAATPVHERRRAILAASDEIFRRFGEPGPDVAEVTDHLVGGGDPIRVRVYRPHATGPLPVHVFIHGGGFWLGSVDELVVDATCRERSAGADCIVVAVDYRLAPEHPFPIPVEDCYRALLWAHEHAVALGGDPATLTIGGVSAGANLAAAVTLAVRDRGGPALALQLLEVPALDLTLSSMAASGVGDDHGITVADMTVTVELYLAAATDPTDPYASPLLAPDLQGLPPAHIMTAEFDPLRLEGERYAGRLREAGVPVVHRRQNGAVHGSLVLTGCWAPARRWRGQLLEALRRTHTGSGA